MRIHVADANISFEFKELPSDAVTDIYNGLLGCIARDRESCPYDTEEVFKTRGYKLGLALQQFCEIHDIPLRRGRVYLRK